MKYVNEFRNRDLVASIASEIARVTRREMSFMEVCGGHTMAIHRFGLPDLLPPEIRLLSGPGCPVCVSSQSFIDLVMAHSQIPGTIISTYGDLIRVPGSQGSLEAERAKGNPIRIIYSVLDALQIAKDHPQSKVIFPAIGFETTAPLTAAAILEAEKYHIRNFYILSAHKVMPPVMKALLSEDVRIDGFIAPGHVSAITGTGIYNDLAGQHGLGVVVAGFEPLDLMQAILMLINQIQKNRPAVENQYSRVVKPNGNRKALDMMEQVFELRNDRWRGLGTIPLSGLKLKPAYEMFDAEVQFRITMPEPPEPKGCICGSILRGRKTPPECSLFGNRCTPSNPIGACMVSGEGTCATYYKFRL